MAKEQFVAGIGFDLVTAIRNTIERMGLVDSGYLKNYVFFEVKGGEIIIHFPFYAEYLEFGYPSFEIKPKNKKALFWEGANHPVKKVTHPGIRPYAFIRKTIHSQINKIIAENAERHL